MYIYYKIALAVLISSIFVINAHALDSFSFGSPMIDAAESGNEYVIANLLKNKQSPNVKGKFGVTPLMRATINGHYQTVKILLEAGADPNATDVGGASPLHLAARTGKAEIVDLLIKYGASSDVKDFSSYTPLMRAVDKGDAKSVKMMVEKGANLDILNKYSTSARQMIHDSKNSALINAIKLDSKFSDEKAFESKIGADDRAVIKEQVLGKLKKANVEEAKHNVNYKESIVRADEVKDFNSYMKDPMQSIVKEEYVEDDGEDEVIDEILAEEDDGNIRVVEAIKLPDNIDMNDPNNRITINDTVKNLRDSVKKSEGVQQGVEYSPVVAAKKDYWMEISGFNDEAEALNFWQKASRDNNFKGLEAKLLDGDGPNMKRVIRFGKFNNSGDVFGKCKIARKLNSKVMCYVMNSAH